jgi:thiol-disulfide isomerase/thioredoxin
MPPQMKKLRPLLAIALFLSLPLPVAAQPAARPGSTIEPIPRPVPEFSTRDLDGRPRDWKDIKGKLYLIDFWATWCMPCRETLPQLQAIHAKFSGQDDFSVLGIAVERTQSGAARAAYFARDLGVTYPLYSDFGSNEARKAFSVNAIPDLYLVDAKGDIVERWMGSDVDFDDVEKKVGEWLEKGRAEKKAE